VYDGPTWLDRLILRQIPADWDSRVNSGYIAERVPRLNSKEVANRIKNKLEHRFVECRKVPPYRWSLIYRLKPGLILGENVLREADL
jgi:hypothetical protein